MARHLCLSLLLTLAVTLSSPAPAHADPCQATSCSAYPSCTFQNGNITSSSANDIGIGSDFQTGDCISGTYQNQGVTSTIIFGSEYVNRWVDISVFTRDQSPVDIPAAQYHCGISPAGTVCGSTVSATLRVPGADNPPRLVIVEARGQVYGSSGSYYSTLLSCMPGCDSCGACCSNPGLCDDGNACTTDGCNPDAGGCYHVCNVGAACGCGGTCQSGPCGCR